ncbi:hypothetical protein NP493_1691g00022 [Ridgeia piscesae]|uniref:U3 small nucleolar RNA-associated protein 20 C-terminal domain-containing protein n=1 Tax=Ridgeia piscesae TaxID=27915 RepID=A0AAD9JW41_RIDPI|nr:hypothetical protein NP493_1691g00022 [Ridgeia piscesae]
MSASMRFQTRSLYRIIGIVGVETFTKTYATALRALTERRDIRKRQRATQAVADPELAARRKIKKNLAKKEAKKRRIEELRPTKNNSGKKRKRKA